jgi:hypothetical protein
MIATFALALLAGTAVAATVENIIIKDGNYGYVNGDGDYGSLKSYGSRYAAFELDGTRYVITDDATLDKIGVVLEPQTELGKRQAALGEKQAALGRRQAELGREQAELGRQQAAAAPYAQDGLSERQRELGEKQRILGDRQRELGDRQRELGEEQRELGKKAEKALENIFRNAVRNGVAQRR